MLNISRFCCEHLECGCITDKRNPVFSFIAESDRKEVTRKSAVLTVNGEQIDAIGQIAVPYAGRELLPFTVYEAVLTITDSEGETAESALTFETGRMESAWSAAWISDASYSFTEKKVSPVPMMFRPFRSAVLPAPRRACRSS